MALALVCRSPMLSENSQMEQVSSAAPCFAAVFAKRPNAVVLPLRDLVPGALKCLYSVVPGQPDRGSVFCDPKSTDAQRALSGMGVRFVADPRQADLVWMGEGYTYVMPHLQRNQMLKHVEDEGAIINKARLTDHLAAHERASPGGLSSTEFCPESYRLSYDDPVKASIVPEMLRETAGIALDFGHRLRRGAKLTDLESIEGFDWVIREE
jgi:hypothetical protein